MHASGIRREVESYNTVRSYIFNAFGLIITCSHCRFLAMHQNKYSYKSVMWLDLHTCLSKCALCT